MKVLGIDPGTKCGWALMNQPNGKAARLIAKGTWDLKPRRHQSAGMRFVLLRRSLTELLEAEKSFLVAYEEVRGHKGTDAAHIYGGLVGAIQVWCIDNEIDYTGVPVGTIKKTATGKGNANKNLVLAAAAERWPAFFKADTKDFDAADAAWCAACVLRL